jgi:hypothetical protein
MRPIRALIQALEAYMERSGVRVLRSALPDRVHGRLSNDHIMVHSGLNPREELAALVHEMAHWLVHQNARPGVDCTLFEYEAEAVEALVLGQLGLGGNFNIPTDNLLSASVARVQRAQTRICDALSEASEAQAPIEFQTTAREEIVFEYEQYGMGDFLGLPEAL